VSIADQADLNLGQAPRGCSEAFIGGHKRGRLALGQRDVAAVIDGVVERDAKLERVADDFRNGRKTVKCRGSAYQHEPSVFCDQFASADVFPERVGDLRQNQFGCNECGGGAGQLTCLIGVMLLDEPFHRDAGINDEH